MAEGLGVLLEVLFVTRLFFIIFISYLTRYFISDKVCFEIDKGQASGWYILVLKLSLGFLRCSLIG